MDTRLLLLSIVVATVLVACDNNPAPSDGGLIADGGDSGTPPADSGVDASIPRDASPDAPMDDAQVPMDDAQVPTDDAQVDGGLDGGGGCLANEDCFNTDLCDGDELCVEGTCMPAATPRDCADSLACTADTCDAALGCVHTPLNADGDIDDACVDCDDSNAARNSGATEICNALDDDCDLATDEGASATNYGDCDGDGWATLTAVSFDGCTPPAVTDTGCGTPEEAWTTRVATDADFDCADDDTRAHSGTTAYHTTPIASAFPESDFDFDCDFLETPEFPTQGACSLAGASCTTTAGWVLPAIPECGESALFITACTAACVPTTATRTQGCR